MPEKIWVKAAHPRASLYQEVLELSEDGGPAKMVIEHIRAHTHPITGEQVPVPMQVTDTPLVQHAFLEKLPGTDVPARIVRCTQKEIDEHLKGGGSVAAAAAAPSKAAAKKASSPKAKKVAGKGVVAEPEE